jgi:hypothetical protein
VEGAGGCCVRFKKLEDISLDVIGESVRRTPAKAYVENYVKMLAKRGGGGQVAKKAKGEASAKKVAARPAAKGKVKKTAKR